MFPPADDSPHISPSVGLSHSGRRQIHATFPSPFFAGLGRLLLPVSETAAA